MSENNDTQKAGDTVVIALDGSDQAEEAFNWYLEHIHTAGNRVVLAHAMEYPSMPSRDSWEQQQKTGEGKKKGLTDKYQEKLKDNQLQGEFVSDFEKPGEYVVRVARDKKATMVIIGTRGLGKLRRTVMGSVSDYVVHHAHCPVLVCRRK